MGRLRFDVGIRRGVTVPSRTGLGFDLSWELGKGLFIFQLRGANGFMPRPYGRAPSDPEPDRRRMPP